MKKILTLLFVMATALMSFSGCQSQGESYGNYNENSKDMYGDDWQLSIFSYDEYVKFTKAAKLPEYFVSYEDISEFGEFLGFVCLSKSQNGDYSSLLYSFVDETGTEFSMYVNYIPQKNISTEKNEKPIINLDKINVSDMRTAQVTEASKYLHNGIEYSYYSSGKLHSIVWRCGDIEYKLHEGLNTYSVSDKATALSKMLKLESASQVASKMKSYTNKAS